MSKAPLGRFVSRVARAVGRRNEEGASPCSDPSAAEETSDSEKQAVDSRSSGETSEEAVSAAVPAEEPAAEETPSSAAPPSSDGASFFHSFGLDERIVRALTQDLAFEQCTPVQDKVLPHSLAGVDVTGRAQTGTGKTAAFLITICQHWLKQGARTDRQTPMALIVAPTRELAVQIDSDAEAISRHCGLRHLAVYGGMDYTKQRDVLAQGVDLLTATPGRLIDYARRRAVDLSEVEILVLDEADRMLDMGFMPDVRRIVMQLPRREKRQTMLFGATLTPPILRLAQGWMREPVTIEVEPETVVAEEIVETLYAVAAREKLALLLWILQHEAGDRALVFRNRRNTSYDLVRKLARYGVDAALLSGDVPQKRRLKVLEGFREGRIRVIVATDVAGRGIHVDDISHVVNYDLPYEADDYVHRIGRTGRAGVTGKAISFACERESFILPEIEKYIGHEIPVEHPSAEMLKLPRAVRELPPESGSSGGERSRRPHRGGRRGGGGGRRRDSRGGSGRGPGRGSRHR